MRSIDSSMSTEDWLAQNPTEATAAGLHEYDDKLEDYSKAGNTSSRSDQAIRRLSQTTVVF
jgi:hypothetical protein